MTTQARIKVRPGQVVRFPGQCASCGRQPATSMTIRHSQERRSRQLDVPLCQECGRQLQLRSGDEERLQRLGRILVALVALLSFLIIFLLAPAALGLAIRLLLAFALALAALLLVVAIWRRALERAALPQKRAIAGAVRIVDFSHATTTLAFADELFAERFARLNESQLIES